MTDLKASSEFQTYPNDPELWLVLSDWLLDHGDESGAELARQKAAFWEWVRESGRRPFENTASDLTEYCWAEHEFAPNLELKSPQCPHDHPGRIPYDLFMLLPGDFCGRNPGHYWQLEWRTEEAAWDALWRAWQKWRGGSSDPS